LLQQARETWGAGDGLHAEAAVQTRGLVALDERLRQGTQGIVLVRATSLDAARAVREHVARRMRATSSFVVMARSRQGAPLWQDVLLQLEPHAPGSRRNEEGHVSVERLVAAAAGRQVVVVAPVPALVPGGGVSWDQSMAIELASRSFIVVFVDEARAVDASFDPAALETEPFDVAADLDDAERDCWWSVLAASATRDVGDLALSELEAWWARARRLDAVPEAPRPLTKMEAAIVGALALAGRPWPVTEVGALGGDPEALHALVRDDFIRETAGWLTLAPSLEEQGDPEIADPAVLTRLAASLASTKSAGAKGATDPWASARAAELYLSAGDFVSADAAMEHALGRLEDAAPRSEMTQRWASAVAASAPEARVFLQCRGAERALAVGEAEEAHRWARAAATSAPDDAGVTLILGRSLVALGDLVAAEVTLLRGQRSLPADDLTMAALLAVELAEVSYLKGDMASAGAGAERALATALSIPVAQSGTQSGGREAAAREAAAKARNTLGKILLAEAKWDQADRHFAEDALMASAQGDTTAELRARLNRGIAFLSNGALDEARAVFDEVRAEGERLGDFRATAFALDNLAVVATWRHDYAEALSLSERTLKLRQRLGDRLTTARIVGNLAELRRKLGLVDHAEHAIAFGRRALGPGMPAERSAHFSFVAARVALDRGHTETAHREITRAIRDAELAGHPKILAEAHRVSARIALEDGDLARARASLVASRELTVTDEARAEVALLDALLARAAGEDAEELGLEALGLARAVGEEEALLEAHLLLCEIYRASGDGDAARSHLTQAIALREQVTTGLPREVVVAFLARRDVAQITRLEAQLASDALATEVFATSAPREPSLPLEGSRRIAPATSSASRAAAVELVGVDPVMRSLHATIKKVARSSSTVLIRGESGTGKELVAAALHRASDRAAGPMVTVNCAALVETLLLSELFGHEKGAFTGATARRRGRFELAEGGTLFLDEIGDISPKTQVALLRVLQERTFERVGGTAPIRVDVHIICATHRDLRAMVERGEFREDLYYRLRGITLEVPALRARTGDLPALADHLLKRIAEEREERTKSLTPGALELLALHRWPGNVRELENALRAASLFAETDVIGECHLTENVDDLRAVAQKAGVALRQARLSTSPSTQANDTLPPAAPPSSTVSPDSGVDSVALDGEDGGDWEAPLPSGEANATAVAYAQVRQGALSLSDLKRQIERDCIARALAETKGNITKAAALLGMKRPRLSQLVKQYGLAAVMSEAL